MVKDGAQAARGGFVDAGGCRNGRDELREREFRWNHEGLFRRSYCADEGDDIPCVIGLAIGADVGLACAAGESGFAALLVWEVFDCELEAQLGLHIRVRFYVVQLEEGPAVRGFYGWEASGEVELPAVALAVFRVFADALESITIGFVMVVCGARDERGCY